VLRFLANEFDLDVLADVHLFFSMSLILPSENTQDEPTEHQLERLREGVEIATGLTYPAKVKSKGLNVRIIIHEGKKRQVRRMFETVGLTVKNLKRIRINKYVLPATLQPGQFIPIKTENIL
jgi:23S rRNA pseudouridine2605 synthase